jgi:hypothetical protein
VPQFGLRTKDQIPPPPAVDLSTLPPLPWALPGAEVVQVTFEVDLDAALALLPDQLSRTAPPIGRVLVARYPASPIGPFAEALLLLWARHRMNPLNYAVAAVATTDAARDALAGLWNVPAVTGELELRRAPDPATGTEDITVRVVAGGPLCELHLPGAYAVEPAMVRYDPLVSVRAAGGDEMEVIQFSGAATVHEARLAKGAAVICRTDAWADPWFRLRSLNVISATVALADLERTEPVVQQARPPGALAGGGLP